jgi:hypothetical protein
VASDINEALRNEVAGRAQQRCEYCRIHQADTGFRHQVDHIVSRKHGGQSTVDNLAYACVLCNRSKGADVASINGESGEIVRLFHPRRDSWADHFRLDASLICARSQVGAVTIELLRFNAPERLVERGLLQTLGSYPTEV